MIKNNVNILNRTANTNLLFCFLMFFSTQIFSQSLSSRNDSLINNNWKFTQQPTSDPFRADYDDSKWETVTIPHCFNNTDPYDDDNDYYRGIVWYRKKMAFNESFKNKKLFLRFDGVNNITDVFVNGAFAGRHKGGYTAFNIDITSFVKPDGSENVIALMVNNAPNLFVPPLDIGYTVYGGVYRNVHLITTEMCHFSMNDYGSSGVYVTMPNLWNQLPMINVKVKISNELSQHNNLTLSNRLFDNQNKLITTFKKEIFINGQQESVYEINSELIDHPYLWSPEIPYLFRLETCIIENNQIIDSISNKVAFKEYYFDADMGFILNGKKYVLKGTNRHQDMMGKGSALSEADHERDLQIIKNMGCNFLRLAHYPQDPYVLKRADELGIFIWEEIPLVNYMNISDEFVNNCGYMIREMIRQHYNHPSVILWGSMNEIFLNDYYNKRAQKITDSIYGVNVRKAEEKLDRIVREEDSSRYSTIAMHMSSDYDKYKIDVIPQVAGYNIYNGWYSGKVEEFGPTFDKKHAQKPNQVILVSEYGAESDLSVNTEHPTRLDNTGQYQRYFHESYLEQIKQRPYFAGTAIWNQFDFGNPNIGGTISNINHKGMYTWDRKPKDAYYLYKANWNPDPMVYIATRDWPIRKGIKGDSSTIDVYSNAKEVTLYVNGKSVGKKKTNGIAKATWKVLLKDDKNKIIANAVVNKKLVTDTSFISYKMYDTLLNNFESIQNTDRTLRINCGSNAQYMDNDKNIWIEDKPYSKGSFGYTTASPSFISLKGKITNTNKTPLLYTYLNDVKSYRLDMPDGDYEIELFFAEPEFHEAGKRVFDVLINNNKVLTDFDLNKEASYCEAVTKKFIVVYQNNEGIEIKFDNKKGKAIINGIAVRKK
jgi:beta-galactosidase